jgi:AcrR family transcriptional regulator
MKKQDIFNTTLSLVVRQGLYDTPMSQIAKESNAAIGTIYHHFKNKEELIQALYTDIHKELEAVVEIEEIDVRNYKAEFTALFLRVFKFFIQNPLKFHFLEQYEHSPFGFNTEELDVNIEYPLRPDFFSFGQEQRLIRQMPLSLISNIIYTNVANLVRLQLAQKIELNREMLELVIDGCWEMVKR